MGKYLSHLYCKECFEKIYTTNEIHYYCPKCNGILETVYEYDEEFIKNLKNNNITPTDIMPFNDENYIYIGQGRTPLVKVKNLFKDFNISLYLKNEQQNPTGSFKDRPVGCGMSKAKEMGIDSVVVASSGNGAAAVSAFAASSNMKAKIFVPESTPNEKVEQALFYGAEVCRIPGPYSNSYKAAIESGRKDNSFNLTTTFINPYTVDGDKQIAYELYSELGFPDYIFVPIGAGPLLVGILKGYEELKKLNSDSKIPIMVGVQAEGCNPIEKAFKSNRRVVSEKKPKSIAGAICDGLDGYEKDGDYTIDAIKKSGGFSISIKDEEILYWQRELAINEGIFVEPSSASTIAAIFKNKELFIELEKTNVVALMTGHGLKDMSIIKK